MNNEKVKEAARLKRKRHRYGRRQFLTEGEDLLDAALKRGIVPRQVFVLEGHEGDIERRADAAAAGVAGRGRRGTGAPAAEIYTCAAAVMEKLSELGSGSRVAAVFDFLDRPFPDMSFKGGPILFINAIGDPGNVGTLIRSAAALGAAGVLLGRNTADPYSYKSLRATMGALFQVPLSIDVEIPLLSDWSLQSGTRIICTDPHSGNPAWEAPLGGSFVLVLGSEREGPAPGLKAAAGRTVRIPRERETESINVAMAGTAILYEAMRQRSTEDS